MDTFIDLLRRLLDPFRCFCSFVYLTCRLVDLARSFVDPISNPTYPARGLVDFIRGLVGPIRSFTYPIGALSILFAVSSILCCVAVNPLGVLVNSLL